MTFWAERNSDSMEYQNSPRGLIVDLLTPLNSDGSIDGHGLGRLLDSIIPYVQGIFIASPQSGEGINLGTQQKVELFAKTLDVIREKVPVFFWVSGDSEKAARDNYSKLNGIVVKRKYRGKIFWVDTPLYYHSNRGLPVYYKEISSIAGRPIILHNNPEFVRGADRPLKRLNIRTSILKEISSIGEIAGMVYSGSLGRVHNYQKACRGRKNFRIYDENEGRFLNYPSMSGVVSLGANLFPGQWQKVTLSSLHISSEEKGYPNYIKQVWESGLFLRKVMEIYDVEPVSILKRILCDKGLIDFPYCTHPSGDIKEPLERLKSIIGH